MKNFSEEVVWEKAGRDAATKTAKDKIKAANATEKRAAAAKKAQALAEKRLGELTMKQNEMDLKLAEAVSLNATLTEELADFWAALEACENKWYNEGFADTEEGVESVVKEARQLCFQEGWMAALHASGMLEDSHLRDPSWIPFPYSLPAAQNPTGPIDEEETDSLKELVEQIDAHVEVIGTKATNNPPTNNQSSENAQYQPHAPEHQPSKMATETQPVVTRSFKI